MTMASLLDPLYQQRQGTSSQMCLKPNMSVQRTEPERPAMPMDPPTLQPEENLRTFLAIFSVFEPFTPCQRPSFHNANFHPECPQSWVVTEEKQLNLSLSLGKVRQEGNEEQFLFSGILSG